MRVAGLGYSDGARNLEVMLESLSGGKRREMQEHYKYYCEVIKICDINKCPHIA